MKPNIVRSFVGLRDRYEKSNVLEVLLVNKVRVSPSGFLS